MSFKYYDLSLGTRRHRRRHAGWVWAYLAGVFSGVLLLAAILSQ
ncbi:MAG: hypothetical protein Q8Q73_03380 [Stagnimonas sp.]|nr:hypothetical protein [Stagnimonas sp.]